MRTDARGTMRPGWPAPLTRAQTALDPVLSRNYNEEYRGRYYLVLEWSNGWKQW